MTEDFKGFVTKLKKDLKYPGNAAVNNTKLKPCPFCGSAEIKIIPIRLNYVIVCCKCSAAVGMFEKEKSAVKAWNRRVKDV